MSIIPEASNDLYLQVTRCIGINSVEEDYFTKLFETTVNHLISANVREAWIYLSDFVESEDYYQLKSLRLMVIRKTIYTQDQWHGIIQDHRRQFKVIAVLEN